MAFGSPDFLRNLETRVMRIPNIDEKLIAMKGRMKKFAEMREERAANTQAAAAVASAPQGRS